MNAKELTEVAEKLKGTMVTQAGFNDSGFHMSFVDTDGNACALSMDLHAKYDDDHHEVDAKLKYQFFS